MDAPVQSILLITNEFYPAVGGVATYCYELARAISGLGQRIAIIAARKTPVDPSLDKTQIFPIHWIREHPLRPVRHLVRLSALAKYTCMYRPACLWASDWRTGLVVIGVASRFSLPYVVSAYGSDILLADRNALSRFLARQVYSNASTVLSISHYTKGLLTDFGVPEHKVRVTLLGVDPAKWHIDPAQRDMIIQRHSLAGKKTILSLARLTPRKGHDTVLRALPIVLRSVSEVVYIIAGTGADEERLRRLTAELGLENHVVFAGYISEAEKPAYYHACDVYAMLSRQEGPLVEGFGLTLLEAAACGKPVIAGRHGGTTDTVIDGTTGLLVDPNDLEATASALIRLLSDRELAKRLGQNARCRVEVEANWHRVACQMLDILERII